MCVGCIKAVVLTLVARQHTGYVCTAAYSVQFIDSRDLSL